jgi:hypothetical protein
MLTSSPLFGSWPRQLLLQLVDRQPHTSSWWPGVALLHLRPDETDEEPIRGTDGLPKTGAMKQVVGLRRLDVDPATADTGFIIASAMTRTLLDEPKGCCVWVWLHPLGQKISTASEELWHRRSNASWHMHMTIRSSRKELAAGLTNKIHQIGQQKLMLDLSLSMSHSR